MTDIFNKLNLLKNKLNDLEQSVSEEVKREESKVIYKERINKKLPFVKEYQNSSSRVKINVGNELILQTSTNSINTFPYKLTLKDAIKNLDKNGEIFIDSSESLFSAILEIIRTISNNQNLEIQKKMIISCHPDALHIHANEYFLEDTDEVLKKFDFIYSPPWVKRVSQAKPRQDPNKWPKDTYILCYSCGSQNDGTHWRKHANSDRSNDNYCIDNYIATCLVCDPSNTLQY